MPPLDLTKPEVQKFLIENYEKTASLRIRWNVLHREKLLAAAKFTGEEKGYTQTDVLKSVLESGMATIIRGHKNAYRHRMKKPISPYIPGIKDLRKTHTIVTEGLGDPKIDPRLTRPDDDLSLDPLMRPVPQKQSEKIYLGIPEHGRLDYLKERSKMKLEDKYYFQETGWIGWRLKDSYFSGAAPQYPQMGVLFKTLLSRTPGFIADPKHYTSSMALMQGKQGVLSSSPQ